MAAKNVKEKIIYVITQDGDVDWVTEDKKEALTSGSDLVYECKVVALLKSSLVRVEV